MRKPGGSSKSRIRLLTAVTELLDSGTDTERVTITDVVSAAGMTRPTFYAIFDDLPAAFAASALDRLDTAFSGLGVDPDVSSEARSEQMRSAFEAILHRLSTHSDFFARVLRGPGGPIVQKRIVDYVAERLRESSPVSRALAIGRLPLEMSSAAIAAGVVWTMIRWMDDEDRRPVPEIAVQLRDFVETSVFGGLGRSLGEPGVDGVTPELNGELS